MDPGPRGRRERADRRGAAGRRGRKELNEKQLGGLENEIQKRGAGHEEEAVKAWMADNPGIADTMAPL
ncbi:hypothetical protein AN221_38730 [Streptomyces nanshensis]|uniref:Uncharacterized protein n=1 Tax=Streptomyces nanshensis TaxID=518642 RepID=A0A1E7LHW2_9ACTN|nr:hypothetical protein AN221_38730 [Streptomyces nanshensis]